MEKKIIEMLLGLLKPEIVAKIIVGILWELAKLTDNKLDDQIVKSIADGLGVDISSLK